MENLAMDVPQGFLFTLYVMAVKKWKTHYAINRADPAQKELALIVGGINPMDGTIVVRLQ
jgi:hypothetical protein